MEESWSEIRRYLTEVFDWAGPAIEAEELAVIPGLDELFGLTEIKAFADDGSWDVVVVDCAPTAETIRLLSLPEVLSWYMDRIFPLSRRLHKVVGPVVSRVSNLPVAGDEVFGATERFYARLDGVRDLLTDPEVTTARLVVNPERMVIAEAAHLHLPLAVRVPRRCGRREPRHARCGGGPLVQALEGRARRAPQHHPRELRPLAGAAGRPGRARDRGPRAARRVRQRALWRGRAGGCPPPVRAHAGRPRRRRGPPHARAPVRQPGRGRRRSAGGRAGRHRRPVSPGHRSPDSLRRRAVRGAGLDDGVLTVRFGEPSGELEESG